MPPAARIRGRANFRAGLPDGADWHDARGARQVDHILDQTVLPDLSRRLLEQMSSDKMPSGVRMGVDDNNEFTYEFSFEY